jgi:glutathione synthase
LKPREAEIAVALAVRLHELKLYIAGIDLIDEHITEINVTTPAGFFPLRKLYQHAPEALLWDEVEKRLA